MKKKICLIYIYSMICISYAFSQQYPKREMRGVWVAAVENIDWPSSPTESSGEQISELVGLFDKLKAAGINTIFFQVRTECDALYKSSFESWSYWLTGKQGKPPDPFYDPLEFAVKEAHSRGMELHAWINPYRAVKDTSAYKISSNHISNIHPEWIMKFGKLKILNPGIPEVTNYIVKIVSDIAARYQVDGIHFDDYFYPYSPQITNEDSADFRIYGKGFTNIDDWRRNNINSMIAKVYEAINKINPKIIFGVSPYGIVENKYADTQGFNSYDKIYCDPLTWIKEKTVDYIAPQLYWEIGNKYADFKKLLPWWASVKDERQIYAGLSSIKMASPDWNGESSELYDEMRMTRKFRNVDGIVFYRAKSIADNYSGLADTLRNSFFRYPALVPVMKWKNFTAPPAPSDLTVEGNNSLRILKWSKPNTINYSDFNYIIYKFTGNEKLNLNNPENIISVIYNDNSYNDNQIINDEDKITYIVTSLNNEQIESIDFAARSFSIQDSIEIPAGK